MSLTLIGIQTNLHEEAEEHETADDGDGGADEGGGLPDLQAALRPAERRVEAGRRVRVVELRLRRRREGLGRCKGS